MSQVLSTPADRLAALRTVMREHAIDAWWLPSSDPHNSEYLPEHWAGRAWLSGFDGSVGTLVVTQDAAGVWVDSRYFVQAEAQLAGSGIAMMKLVQGQATAPMEWLAERLPAGATVGYDAQVVALAHATQMEEILGSVGIARRGDLDLLDAIWPDRPALPAQPLYAQPAAFRDETRPERLARVRAAMAEQGADWHPISTLDDIAWLTQLRGDDVAYNPVFLAHLLVGRDTATLFVAPGTVEAELEAALAADGIDIAPYDDWRAHLAALPAESCVLLDPARLTLGTRQALPAEMAVAEAFQPSTLDKGCKTDQELAHVRRTMEADGAALCRFFAWLEQALARGERVTELDVETRLREERARDPHFVSESFNTIAAFNANGALPHYRATPEAHAVIEGDGLLLIDSGGQYHGGTTDITRMVPVGEVSAAQREDCSLVLKGTIALSRARFPQGIAAPRLDAIARAPLWATGRDYGHGTGHGVGYFLNVHEGPQVISIGAPVAPHTAMREGMITSIEPGVYRPGQWGVRIENLVANRPAEASDFGDFLRFETLTLCPIDTRCLDVALLDAAEAAWLDAYHAEVYERLAPHLEGDALAWLEARTRPLARG
ncbi:aminopeptidase P family protein [Halomonas icarae]|uniref:M24 family metallopeptidase n=1 Tax=Halomonas icarae TaxID=2691040 RepID=A0A7X4VY78_9GAMM|nr:aminopeptidase P family protein [Halomonas icarae]MDR5902659.1 aminopeptidase P family protein [Halomonas icarae]NAW12517.1 M24 family metallopeptidase [Halomonas icarae]